MIEYIIVIVEHDWIYIDYWTLNIMLIVEYNCSRLPPSEEYGPLFLESWLHSLPTPSLELSVWTFWTWGPGGQWGGGRMSNSLPSPLIICLSYYTLSFLTFLFNFLLSSCLLFLCFKLLQIVLVTSSSGAGRREIRRFVVFLL